MLLSNAGLPCAPAMLCSWGLLPQGVSWCLGGGATPMTGLQSPQPAGWFWSCVASGSPGRGPEGQRRRGSEHRPGSFTPGCQALLHLPFCWVCPRRAPAVADLRPPSLRLAPWGLPRRCTSSPLPRTAGPPGGEGCWRAHSARRGSLPLRVKPFFQPQQRSRLCSPPFVTLFVWSLRTS